MCIRDREKGYTVRALDSLKFGGDALYEVMFNPNFEFIKGDIRNTKDVETALKDICLLYTSDAADERSSVDLGGRRIIKKKKNITQDGRSNN